MHEAWPRLQRALENCNDVHHLMSIAATAMRQIIVDHVRYHRRRRRSAAGDQIRFEELVDRFEARSGGVAALDEALRDLQEADPESAELVTLYFFGGYSVLEIAQARAVSSSTIKKRLQLARGALERRLAS